MGEAPSERLWLSKVLLSHSNIQINPVQRSHVVELTMMFGSFLKCGYVDSKPTGKLFLSERN